MRISSASSHRSVHRSRATDLLIGVVSVTLVFGQALPAQAEDDLDDLSVLARRVTFEPQDGTRIEVDGRVYAGSLRVSAHPDGLALVEETTIDNYLLGIREVPFSWEREALEAQAVAARTYLAWTLQRGRSANGRRYGYDICATVACQVYAGVGGVSGQDGDRWERAVASTKSEILVFRGRPAQTLYSSTSSGRTRNVEDVFVGSNPLPYLTAVESTGETSPFVSWSFIVTESVMEAMLRDQGLLQGELMGMETAVTDDGDGPWMVTIKGTDGTETIDTWTLRTRLNRAGASVFPERFPVRRPGSDRRYPQTIMSPSFVVLQQLEYRPPIDGPPEFVKRYLIRGGGWGHLVGMSQYGAQTMATEGADHVAILSHYYGGLVPQDGSSLLPATVEVGLGVGLEELRIVPERGVDVVIDGIRVGSDELGGWTVRSAGDRMLVTPPVGLGFAPAVGGWRVDFDDSGRAGVVRVDSATAAEITITIRSDSGRIWSLGPAIREAGTITLDLNALDTRTEQALTIIVVATSANGEDIGRLRLLFDAE
jgi:stage II sporulation protein D